MEGLPRELKIRRVISSFILIAGIVGVIDNLILLIGGDELDMIIAFIIMLIVWVVGTIFGIDGIIRAQKKYQAQKRNPSDFQEYGKPSRRGGELCIAIFFNITGFLFLVVFFAPDVQIFTWVLILLPIEIIAFGISGFFLLLYLRPITFHKKNS